MRKTIELVDARLTHVGSIASRMREADRIECRALGRSPKDGLRIGLRASLHPLTVLIEGRPEAMMGVVPQSMIAGAGTIWMLGTDAIYSQGRALLRLGPLVLGWMMQDFREVSNIVSTENARAIRFMVRMGFEVGGEVATHGGVDFIPFLLRRSGIEISTIRPSLRAAKCA